MRVSSQNGEEGLTRKKTTEQPKARARVPAVEEDTRLLQLPSPTPDTNAVASIFDLNTQCFKTGPGRHDISSAKQPPYLGFTLGETIK